MEFFNRNFPDENALNELQPFTDRISRSRDETESTIGQLLHDQSKIGPQSMMELQAAQEAIEFLFLKIQEIKSKAEKSEIMVQEICRDIKQLDYAKRHLQTTITALKRLNMLDTAVDQLEMMSSQQNYRTAAGLLKASTELFTYFQHYMTVTKIVELHESVNNIRDHLVDQVLSDFQAVGNWIQEGTNDTMLQNLSASCMIIDVVGGPCREKLIQTFCQDQFSQYQKTFGHRNAQGAGLDNAERRFPWFYRFLRDIQEKIDTVFPSEWKITRRLALAFCQLSESHLVDQLKQEEIDVTNLLKALQKTLLFEKDMVERFDTDGDSFSRSISRAFEPYLQEYVALERKNMEEMLQDVMATERVDRDGPLPVFSSSVNMFVYIRNSVKRCTALTTGQTFFHLHQEFKKCLQNYAQRLTDRLSLDTEEVCFIINTCEYCAETLPSLADAIIAKIDQPFQDAVDVANEADVFHDVAAASMRHLVDGLQHQLEPYLINLVKMPWASWESVGDQSDYVVEMEQLVEQYVPTVRQMLPALYFNSFCDKFVTSFLPKFLQAVLKCKRINEMGTQQLLLDTYGLKTMMLQLPVMGMNSTTVVPNRYTKLVTNELSRIETALKLIGTPNDMLVQSFKLMWPDGTAVDFQRILAVKGVKKTEQQQMMEILGLEQPPSSTKKLRFGFT